MTIVQIILASGLCVSCQTEDTGTIGGKVVNASRSQSDIAGAEVVLQILQDGEFVPIAREITDEHGEFLFEGLPMAGNSIFLPVASRDGVFHPGERIRLDPGQRNPRIKLAVYDAVRGASPLVADHHEILLRPEPGILNVTETIQVANPSSGCYVGETGEDKGSVTLRLRIPSSFEKVTFHKEFFGRRFSVIDGQLVTTVPWPPGVRELKFDYVMPIEQQSQIWERPLDLPCSDVRVRLVQVKPNEVSCNLSAGSLGANDEIIFESKTTGLPAGHVVQLELGRLPAPALANARWIALALLGALILATTFFLSWQRRRMQRQAKLARPPHGRQLRSAGFARSPGEPGGVRPRRRGGVDSRPGADARRLA